MMIKCLLEFLVHNPLMCGVHVHNHQAARILCQNINAVQLSQRKAEWMAILFFLHYGGLVRFLYGCDRRSVCRRRLV